MESARKVETPSKQKQRERLVSFPAQDTPTKTRGGDVDLYSKSRRKSHSSENGAEDMADPLQGDLSFSMPHFGPGDDTDDESSDHQSGASKLRETDETAIEMTYITPRRRKNAAGE